MNDSVATVADEEAGPSAEVLAVGDATVEHKLRADAARNRERVLAAALAVFAERGLDASLDEVAHRAGVGVGTVYRRFPNKEALIEALFEEKIESIEALAHEAAEYEDAWEGFVHFFERALQWQVENRGLRQVLLLAKYDCEQVSTTRDVVTPILSEMIERAQAAGKLRSDLVANDVPMLVTMIGAVSDYVGGSDPDLWQRYLTLILDGLATERRSPSPLVDPPSDAVIDAAMTRCHES